MGLAKLGLLFVVPTLVDRLVFRLNGSLSNAVNLRRILIPRSLLRAGQVSNAYVHPFLAVFPLTLNERQIVS